LGRRPIRLRRGGGWGCTKMEQACVPFLRTDLESGSGKFHAVPKSGSESFQNRAARTAELPARSAQSGRGIGFRLWRAGRRWLPHHFGCRRTGTGTNRRRRRRFCRGTSGRPLTGVVDDSPHPVEPPVGPTRTVPASVCGFEPRLVLKTQFQLAADHGSPLPFVGDRVGRAADSLSPWKQHEPVGKTGADGALATAVGKRLGVRK